MCTHEAQPIGMARQKDRGGGGGGGRRAPARKVDVPVLIRAFPPEPVSFWQHDILAGEMSV